MTVPNLRSFGSRSRRYLLSAGVVGIFAVLSARLAYMQVYGTAEYGRASELNAVRKISVEPARGIIYDRYGRLLVENRPYYSVTVTPKAFDTSRTQLLASLLGQDPAELRRTLAEARAYSAFAPSRVARDVSFATFSSVEEHGWQLPGVEVVIDSKRHYPPGITAAHLFGYLNEISRTELEKRKADGYQMGDLIGSSGIERSYETDLRGVPGTKLMMVNVRGQQVGEYDGGSQNIPPVEGRSLYTALDADVQRVAEFMLRGRRGGAVAIDPNNGEIIALASKPDYAPDSLSGRIPLNLWRRLNTDPNKPLYNRAIQAEYPPGSTWKMVLALAALNDRVVSPTWTVTCGGGFSYGGHYFRCTHVHGAVNATSAIQHSCNVYFYQLMFKIGFERFTKYGKLFGFGQRTGIDLPNERRGILPSKEYFDKIYGVKRWTPGYLVSIAIGQGEVITTPLQLAAYIGALANGTTWYEPHLVREEGDVFGARRKPVAYASHPLNIDPQTMAIVRNGMRLVVTAGTATNIRNPDLGIAGKTGTAQNPHGENHAWFVAYAPFDKPRIAVAVLVENAGYGGTHAAPIAQAMIDQFLNRRLTKPLPGYVGLDSLEVEPEAPTIGPNAPVRQRPIPPARVAVPRPPSTQGR